MKSTLPCGRSRECDEVGRFIDLTGQRFGRLKVLGIDGKDKHRKLTWRCLCDCGNETVVGGCRLRSGNTKSCGCFRVDTNKQRLTIHGGSNTRLFQTWWNMKGRCHDKKDKEFKNYGGRGITVCEEWLNDFGAFQAWALCNGYTEELTIDRIDVNKGYSPDNCRWATWKEQGGNRRGSYLTFNGETRTRKEWAEITGIRAPIIASRLCQGFSVERALTQPIGMKKKRKL